MERSTIMPILGLLMLESAQKLTNICNTYIYFILSSEINAYQKQIKVISITNATVKI